MLSFDHHSKVWARVPAYELIECRETAYREHPSQHGLYTKCSSSQEPSYQISTCSYFRLYARTDYLFSWKIPISLRTPSRLWHGTNYPTKLNIVSLNFLMLWCGSLECLYELAYTSDAYDSKQHWFVFSAVLEQNEHEVKNCLQIFTSGDSLPEL